jgi:hypothetical protein
MYIYLYIYLCLYIYTHIKGGRKEETGEEERGERKEGMK